MDGNKLLTWILSEYLCTQTTLQEEEDLYSLSKPAISPAQTTRTQTDSSMNITLTNETTGLISHRTPTKPPFSSGQWLWKVWCVSTTTILESYPRICRVGVSPTGWLPLFGAMMRTAIMGVWYSWVWVCAPRISLHFRLTKVISRYSDHNLHDKKTEQSSLAAGINT